MKKLLLLLFCTTISINCTPENDKDLRYFAFKGNQTKVARALSQGALIDAQDIHGNTALFIACATGHEHIVEYLLYNNAQINIPDNEGFTPLHIAVQPFHTSFFRNFLKSLGDTSIHFRRSTSHPAAIEFKHHSIVRLLISYGALINARTKDKQCTPLMMAIIDGCENIASYLLQKGAEVNIQETEGATALFIASHYGHTSSVEKLLENNADVTLGHKGLTPLHTAAIIGHLKIVELLINHGSPINLRESLGCTSLMLACFNKQEEVVDYLLQNGAEVNIQDDKGATALSIAAQEGATSIVEMLLQKDADTSLGYNGSTPLHTASEYGHNDSIKLLLTHGANIEATKDESTPLFMAALGNQPSTVELLLKNRANIYHRGLDEITVLHLAVSEGHKEIVKILLKHGASRLAIMKDWGTPLDIAQNNLQHDLVLLLKNFRR